MVGLKGRTVLAGLLSFGAIAAMPGVAFAGGAVPTVTPPADGTSSFAVAVSGHITSKCTVDTQDASGDLGAIMNRTTGVADSVSVVLPFSMNCNSPYTAVLVSKNGGLAYEGSVAPQFSGLVDYTAALDMGQIAGGVSMRCDSDMMRGGNDDGDRSACRTKSADDVETAAGDGRIKVTVKGGGLPLQMGTYSDSLILRLSPRV